MKILSVFNNKGGVGKTTLTYHLAHSLSSLGHKVLVMDADPQCNLTIYSLSVDEIHKIWEEEDKCIEMGVEEFHKNTPQAKLNALHKKPRSLHYLLMPTIDGTGEYETLPPPLKINKDLHMIPGRLSIHEFEEKISSRWSDAYRGDALAIRTITRVRALAEEYGKKFKYDYVIIDTSPSLGALNKTIISTVDGFFVPAAPDMFSLYGIRNIGSSLTKWHEEFDIIYRLISSDKRKLFPKAFVQFLGYTIYNARKYTKHSSKWNLAQAHLKYALAIPSIIHQYIGHDLRININDELLAEPIGGESIMHSHNTFPTLAQHYRVPMWRIPDLDAIDKEHQNTINGQKPDILGTKKKYTDFSHALIQRIKLLA
ncbi:ParA family protein [Pseudoduganella armeniaca]|uniref:Cobyrinic acid a,c-diamide synthase n=1 Tax=Pseudoduganella armeniaca TaxID=2072590 RepID=A0A2R4C4D7_9BURK|nr:ParA family protein [Pseudoduganella armeniaca]AVR94493.1 cobyrinic acid a,c-diamide synthase [Pseudoduganella armeniaca]